ncbi:MAG: DNA-binding protein, partial [Gammaproteobacteria bacterium]|nr:DNA-binding protein [Gammaproteobacteria bacterium]
MVKVIPKLQAEGKAITGDNVRAELGTGSKSTITRLLREWKQQQSLPLDDNGSLPSELLTAVKELWRLLQAKADDMIDGCREEYDTALGEMQQQLNQYKAKDSEWQSRVHVLEEKLHQQTEDNKRLNAELITERQEKVMAVERIESFQARHQEGETEKERLHQLLKHVQDNLEHYQTATQQLRLEQDMIMEKQRVAYEQRLLQLQERVELITREKTFLEARCAGLDRDYHASLAREAVVTEEAAKLRQEYIALKANYDTLAQNLDSASEELTAQRQALEAKNSELIECQIKL